VACIATKSDIGSMFGSPKSGHGWAIYEWGRCCETKFTTLGPGNRSAMRTSDLLDASTAAR
jgi:hypothetical protein